MNEKTMQIKHNKKWSENKAWFKYEKKNNSEND